MLISEIIGRFVGWRLGGYVWMDGIRSMVGTMGKVVVVLESVIT